MRNLLIFQYVLSCVRMNDDLLLGRSFVYLSFLSTSHTLVDLVNLGSAMGFVFILSEVEVKKIETVLKSENLFVFLSL